ncbi:uncharacterized protein LOC131669581 isoform X2 [Phymastichus coffea]|uniref:uncharacterized protein LOC131669581 isoform X2 n=1 Tax=Phymastichus coffea TaxID=108790 RepID=UPI00273C6E6F|nr:uncharacterized protein LOC131669581 isoform X2 [Phymastichus coffea]
MMTEFASQYLFNRNEKALRASKQSAIFYSADSIGDENDQILQKLEQRSASLMASIEVSLSASPRRKKGSSLSGGLITPSSHRSREHYKELDSLRVALRDKENIIQTLKGQLCNTLSSRLALRNGAPPPLTEADRKASEERLQRLKRDADNKRLTIKNLKLALQRLDITDNIDVRIQQAELEYRLGREELEMLTLKEESRTLQTALELAETQEKQKSDTIFSCISGSTQLTVHALEVSADPKSPRFGAGPRENAAGLYIDWAVEDSGLCKGDRLLEVNGKLVVGAGRSELARLLAVAPDAAQLVVLRRNDSLAALRTLRSDNLRLTHRIGYLEEQVRDLLAPRTEMSADLEAASSPRQDQLQVFQKGPRVTALLSSSGPAADARQSLPHAKASAEGLRPGRGRLQQQQQQQQQQQLAKSTASLELGQSDTGYQGYGPSSSASPRRRAPRADEQARHRARKSQQLLAQCHEFDSEPSYCRRQDAQSRASQHSEASLTAYGAPDYGGGRSRPAPPKKPLRLSLHRATSLQSVESAPPTVSCSSTSHDLAYSPSKKPTKRNYRGDPPLPSADCQEPADFAEPSSAQRQSAPQPPPRTPSRAQSCQSALRWSSPKPKTSHLPQFSLEKWC